MKEEEDIATQMTFEDWKTSTTGDDAANPSGDQTLAGYLDWLTISSKMDENQLELLLEIIEDAANPAGLDLESLEQVTANEGIGVLYGLMPEGAVESADELENLFPDLKKKDFTNQNQDGSQFDSLNTASTSKPGKKDLVGCWYKHIKDS